MESIHLRCPQCQKLFVVARSEIKSDRPEFQCDGCATKFYMPFPQATDRKEFQTFALSSGEPVKWASIEEKQSKFPCPFCQTLTDKGAAECTTCGRVFEKAKKISVEIRKDFQSSEKLRTAWATVIENYVDETKHEAFIQLALAEKSLPFASQQYRQILNGNSNEPVALKMRERIINLTTLTYVPPKRHQQVVKKSMSVPLILLMFGALLTATGFVFSQLRGIISVGAVIMTLGVGFMAVAKRSGLD